ncbi:MAG: hypothetical protein V4479_04885 [Actinomycetota bacterium]
MPAHPIFVNPTRHWLLVHDGTTHQLEWDDGERLLALTADVRGGGLAPRPFSFTPRGSVDGQTVTVFVDVTSSLELLTQYDAAESHWFG